MKKLFGFLVIGLVLLGGTVFWVNGKQNLLNPLSLMTEKPKSVLKNYKVIGFLPSWMVGKTMDYCGELSHMVFLGIEADEKGNLVWDVQSKRIKSESYLKLKANIKKCSGKNIVGIKLFDDDKIAQLMADPSLQTNLISQIDSVVKENNFDGVNIDFEYQGNPTGVLNEEFVNFIVQLKEANLGDLSVDVFVNSIIKGNVEQINKLLDPIDSLIIMAYDFHRPGVAYAGPVAPIGAPVGERSIWELTQRLTELNLNKKKVVLAYPLYGYEWKTDDENFEAKIRPGWYAMASYKRVKELISSQSGELNFKNNWDETSMTPWINYVDAGENKQIYYENLESLSRKFKIVAENQYGGVGFWALGYEGENREIWEEAENILK